MEANAISSEATSIAVSKQDLVEVWSLLEKLVVSLRKIGSVYAMPSGQRAQAPEQRAAMLEALDRFLSPELHREMAHARRLLVAYLPDAETEHLAENVIQYWTTAGSQSSQIRAKEKAGG